MNTEFKLCGLNAKVLTSHMKTPFSSIRRLNKLLRESVLESELRKLVDKIIIVQKQIIIKKILCLYIILRSRTSSCNRH